MTKLAFFDIDGTLSVPVYTINGVTGIGITDAEWFRWSVLKGEDAYEECKGAAPVRAYAESLKASGAKLFVLSASSNSYESRAKEKFVNRVYPGLFDEIIFTADSDVKLEIIKAVAYREGAELSACELIDDTYKTLLLASAEGMKATHVISLVSE